MVFLPAYLWWNKDELHSHSSQQRRQSLDPDWSKIDQPCAEIHVNKSFSHHDCYQQEVRHDTVISFMLI